MAMIQFSAIVGEDRMIRVPEGITVPPGPMEVTIVPQQAPAPDADVLGLRNWLLEMAAEAEKLPADLPADMAENHDFYAHGKPRE
jgi:hypothetical protein